MKFKEIFDKEVFLESSVRKGLKIIYELKLDLYKPSTEEPKEQPNQQPAQTQNIQAVNPVAPQSIEQPPVPQSVPETPPVEEPQPQEPAPENQEQPEQEPQLSKGDGGKTLKSLFSVVTEDEVSVNDENRIMRSFEGVCELSDSQKDNIQSFEDIVDTLRNYKKNGDELIDDFCSEVLILCGNQKFDELKQKLDKKSKIFVELYYGYKKDDSIGVRFNKRQDSDTLTSTMLVDNKIVSARFNIEKVNQKIAEYRNYDVDKS